MSSRPAPNPTTGQQESMSTMSVAVAMATLVVAIFLTG